ncbi:MAG: hypothetical protein N3D11_08770 [Candidatus Sumerlaeia bacterium]|nr:hypothetical protein [Candidatus Sumerlaeia bacterium]
MIEITCLEGIGGIGHSAIRTSALQQLLYSVFGQVFQFHGLEFRFFAPHNCNARRTDLETPRKETNQRTVGGSLNRRGLNGHAKMIALPADNPLALGAGLNADMQKRDSDQPPMRAEPLVFPTFFLRPKRLRNIDLLRFIFDFAARQPHAE